MRRIAAGLKKSPRKKKVDARPKSTNEGVGQAPSETGELESPPKKVESGPAVDETKVALISYLQLLLESGGDVGEEVSVVVECLADTGCSDDEIAQIVASSGVGNAVAKVAQDVKAQSTPGKPVSA